MKDRNTFYITTPIFYPNGAPHMGHAYTETIADITARYYRLLGKDVHFLTGTDEHSSKVVKAAEKEGKDPRDFADGIVANFKDFFSELLVSYDQFIRTSDEATHWPGVRKIWKKMAEAGDIYKGTYEGLYCVGSESFVTEKDLINGKCPDHDELPQKISEENYFFRLSKYADKVSKLIESDEFEVVPKSRKKEILSFLKEGMKDISFSRPIKDIPWGILVPGDKEQTIYVWSDALTNYISAIGYGRDSENFKKYWPADCHVIGKDILRFHAGIWPAMLLSAGIPLPKKLLVHGMIISGGRKMSKSLGNILDPRMFIKKYGAESLRYYLAREISTFEDGDMTEEKFRVSYNANLANGLGNLFSRISQMAVSYDVEVGFPSKKKILEGDDFMKISKHIEKFEFNKALDYIWGEFGTLDSYIQETEPFKLIKTDEVKAKEIVAYLVIRLFELTTLLEPFLPQTSKTITETLKAEEMPRPLFERI